MLAAIFMETVLFYHQHDQCVCHKDIFHILISNISSINVGKFVNKFYTPLKIMLHRYIPFKIKLLTVYTYMYIYNI